MKTKGIVKEYDGYCGTIVNEQKQEYLLLKKEIMENVELHINDEVSFIAEEVPTTTENRKVARFVKLLKK